jgi:undecaprenyl-diphosphatase
LAGLLQSGARQIGGLGLTLLLGLGAAGLALWLFVALADEVAEGDTARVDLAVLDWLRQFSSPALDRVMWLLSAAGAEVVLVLLVVLLVVLIWQRRLGAAIALLLATGGAMLLNDLLKGFFQRPRPTPVTTSLLAQVFSFPSGHAMVATAFYLFVAYLAWRLLTGWWRVVSTVGVFVLISLICLSRLYLGVHYLTDVIAGVLAGFVWVVAVILAGRFLVHRRDRRRATLATVPAGDHDAPPLAGE